MRSGNRTEISLGCPRVSRTELSLSCLHASRAEMSLGCPQNLIDLLAIEKRRYIFSFMHMRCHLLIRAAQ